MSKLCVNVFADFIANYCIVLLIYEHVVKRIEIYHQTEPFLKNGQILNCQTLNPVNDLRLK